MTYDDDFVRLTLATGTKNIPAKALGLSWPPPERMVIDLHSGARPATDEDPADAVLHRISMSEITDEQRADMSFVVRGAEYKFEGQVR